jgi:pyruvate/2-oxoglutarate dehydrogenase complex dihydrolipoamide acyltransferase (E2) component
MEDTAELRVLQWHAAPGALLVHGALLVELETHKVVIEVRAGLPCILSRILCEEGGWYPSGASLALLSDSPGDALPEDGTMLPLYEADLEIV